MNCFGVPIQSLRDMKYLAVMAIFRKRLEQFLVRSQKWFAKTMRQSDKLAVVRRTTVFVSRCQHCFVASRFKRAGCAIGLAQ